MRARSRTSARRPSIFAGDDLVASISSTACRAGSEFSITSRRPTPKVTMRSQISAPMEPPPPVTMMDLPRTKSFETPVVDLHPRAEQQVLDIDRRKPQRLAAFVERRQPAGDQPQAPRPHQYCFRLRLGRERARRKDEPFHIGAATSRDRRRHSRCRRDRRARKCRVWLGRDRTTMATGCPRAVFW